MIFLNNHFLGEDYREALLYVEGAWAGLSCVRVQKFEEVQKVEEVQKRFLPVQEVSEMDNSLAGAKSPAVFLTNAEVA